ncbi:serine/threonine-protein phosphatase [Amycolatopsis acidiphila]|nr:PP2C family protein-serine/threonine phosphatase [Amycolatopsis acidiphila]UIJ61705.1 serine/threonine-protein phosphatase [Amycolatopsis acidiphila]GHG58311.1 phosphatase [Amycolatopsis acidiphila]
MIERVESWHAVFSEIVNRAHLAAAGDVLRIVGEALDKVGVSLELYLIDLGQQQLRSADGRSPDVDTAMRAFRLTDIIPVAARGGEPAHLWMPVLNGTERLGVARLTLPPGADPHDQWVREQCWVLVSLLGHLVLTKLHYSDLFHTVRRTKPLSVASELLWQLLPPQTFAREQVVVTALMEPYDQVGGDGYDYAVDGQRARVAIFDAMGHDLSAGLTTAIALAATRNARRRGDGLIESAALADRTIHDQNLLHHEHVFATAVLAELDLDTGVLSYLIAGHPPPVLLRKGRRIKTLQAPIRPPLGLGHLATTMPELGEEQLDPGDRLLFYSDGVVEARNPSGQLFGLDRLVELTEQHEAAGLPAPETLRRLTQAVLTHQNGHLQDDATLLLLEWTTEASHQLLPQP